MSTFDSQKIDPKVEEPKFNAGWAAIMIAVLTIFSRGAGMVRQLLIAPRFGAGESLDIYYTAFRLPDIVYNLLVLGTLSVAFIPVFTAYYRRDKAEALYVTNSIVNLAALAMLIICGLLFVLARPLTSIIAPGFHDQVYEQAVTLTRIMLVSPVLFTISSVMGSYLNGLKKFFAAGVAPILYNLGIIFGLYAFTPRYGSNGLGYGVILGAFLHLAFQTISAYRLGYSWRPQFSLTHAGALQISCAKIRGTISLPISLLSVC